jgi:hypothetical protein
MNADSFGSVFERAWRAHTGASEYALPRPEQVRKLTVQDIRRCTPEKTRLLMKKYNAPRWHVTDLAAKTPAGINIDSASPEYRRFLENSLITEATTKEEIGALLGDSETYLDGDAFARILSSEAGMIDFYEARRFLLSIPVVRACSRGSLEALRFIIEEFIITRDELAAWGAAAMACSHKHSHIEDYLLVIG